MGKHCDIESESSSLSLWLHDFGSLIRVLRTMYISMSVEHNMYRGMESLLLSRGGGGTGSD
jgi:hypothetical protein